ncbi:MAG: VWA domain-containing protein [Candidatus Omnitrophota bacterium]
MRFGNLQFLWMLLLVPAGILFFSWAFKSKRRALEKFAQNDRLKVLLRRVSLKKQKLKAVFFILGILFVVLSLIEPKWGYQWEQVNRRGLDIVIALDVSKSMLAEDIKPNRLEAAKREIKSLINILQGDRVGIVAFAGSSFLHCPLTLDYGTAKLFVDYLDINAIPFGGTDIGGAIRQAVRAFEGHEKKHRVLILITDGEDHQEDVMDAVELAKQNGVVIFPIGVGRQEGAPIPVVDGQGRSGFVKDSEGKVVLSKLDSVLLQKIALIAGGKKGSIGAGSFPLEEIYEQEVSKMEKKELQSSRQKRYENRFQYPLMIALLMFVAEAVLSERKNKGVGADLRVRP